MRLWVTVAYTSGCDPVVPLLPFHFYNKEALYSIARLIGEPLKVDASTVTLARPSTARVCVELDLLKERLEEIYVVNGSNGGYWQKVVYEDAPMYCSHCLKIGHDKATCRKNDSAPQTDLRPKKPTAPQAPTARLEYRPKRDGKEVVSGVNHEPNRTDAVASTIVHQAPQVVRSEATKPSTTSQIIDNVQERPPAKELVSTPVALLSKEKQSPLPDQKFKYSGFLPTN